MGGWNLKFKKYILKYFYKNFLGVINFNFQTVNNTYENSASWPLDLGFGIVYPVFQPIPCRVTLGGTVQGWTGTTHPNIKCYIFAG